MRIQDLHILPKFGDSLSYLYCEHSKIEQEDRSIAIYDAEGKVPVPCANLALLMLGPGVSVTHAAISVLADHGCLVVWCGEGGVRYYASGLGETRSSSNFLHQARLWANPDLRLQVVLNLYQLRFSEEFGTGLTLKQIRGMEGVRVREAYAAAARETGVVWSGRNYSRDNWQSADPVNRALSSANACLYGICHAAILSSGFSTALGFIHTGKMLSFVYDVADLYKADITIPVAFRAANEGADMLERRVRIACRDSFVTNRLLEKIIPDIKSALMLHRFAEIASQLGFDSDPASPGGIWDPVEGKVEGGVSYFEDSVSGEET